MPYRCRSRGAQVAGPPRRARLVALSIILAVLVLTTLAWRFLTPQGLWPFRREYVASIAVDVPRVVAFYPPAGSSGATAAPPATANDPAAAAAPSPTVLVPVSRPVGTSGHALGYTAINALLAGPGVGTDLTTGIPVSARLNKVSWRGSLAVVDFSSLPAGGGTLTGSATAQLVEGLREALGPIDRLVITVDSLPLGGAVPVEDPDRVYLPVTTGSRVYLGCATGQRLPDEPRARITAALEALADNQADGRAAAAAPRSGEARLTGLDQGTVIIDRAPSFTARVKDRSLRALALDILAFNAAGAGGVRTVSFTVAGRKLSEVWPDSPTEFAFPRWPNPFPPTAATPRTSSGDAERPADLTVVGDISLARKIDTLMAEHGMDYPLAATASILRKADITAANLEAALTDAGRPLPNKQIWLRGRPANVGALTGAGLDAVGLANNHILDYDSQALAQTIDLLAASGVVWFGAGKDLADARRPAFVEAAGVRVAFLAYNEFAPLYFSFDYPRSFEATATQSGTAPLKPAAAEDDIRAAKAISDAVVVYLHWGVEEADFPRPDQRVTASGFIDAGADLIAGTHPHVLQGFEIHRERLAAYSLGNYVYDQKKPRQVESLILTVEVGPGGTTRPTVIPVRIEEGQPQPVVGDRAATQLNRLADLCGPLGTRVGPSEGHQGYVTAAVEPLR